MRRRRKTHVSPVPIGLTSRILAPRGEPRALEVVEVVAGDVRMGVDRGIRRRSRSEHLIAEGVIEVRVGVRHPAHRLVEALLQVREQCFALRGFDTGVDHEETIVAFDRDNGDVERVVPALVDAGSDGVPCSHATKRSDQPAAKPRP